MAPPYEFPGLWPDKVMWVGFRWGVDPHVEQRIAQVVGARSHVTISRRIAFFGGPDILVTVHRRRDGETFEFTESSDGFPSEELLAKLALTT